MRTIFYTLASIILAPLAFLITLIVAATIYSFASAEYNRFHHKSSKPACESPADSECV